MSPALNSSLGAAAASPVCHCALFSHSALFSLSVHRSCTRTSACWVPEGAGLVLVPVAWIVFSLSCPLVLGGTCCRERPGLLSLVDGELKVAQQVCPAGASCVQSPPSACTAPHQGVLPKHAGYMQVPLLMMLTHLGPGPGRRPDLLLMTEPY